MGYNNINVILNKNENDIFEKIAEWKHKSWSDVFIKGNGRLILVKFNNFSDPYITGEYYPKSEYVLMFSRYNNNYYGTDWPVEVIIDLIDIQDIEIDNDSLIIVMKPDSNIPSKWYYNNKDYNRGILKKVEDIEKVCGILKEYLKLAEESSNNFKLKHENIRKEFSAPEDIFKIKSVVNNGYKLEKKEFECWKNDKYFFIYEILKFGDEKLDKILLEDILFYKIEGGKNTVTKVSGGGGSISGGGSSLGGAVVGGVIAGPVGAVIGSRNSIEGNIEKISTTLDTIDDRIIILKLKTKTMEFIYKDSIEAFENTIPEKDYERIHQKKAETDASDPIEVLKKYKQIFDEGIITKEEFELKKQELLKKI